MKTRLLNGVGVVAAVALFSQPAAAQVVGGCSPICIEKIEMRGSYLHFTWSTNESFDIYNIHWAREGGTWYQKESDDRSVDFLTAPGTTYIFGVKPCNKRYYNSGLGVPIRRPSICQNWVDERYTTPAAIQV